MTSPACTPSRTAFMTGRYPQRYGVHHSDLPEALPRCGLPPNAFTIGKALQAAGYYTSHVGKWHVGEPPFTVEPRKQGFDYFFGGFGGRPSSPWSKYARSMDPEVQDHELDDTGIWCALFGEEQDALVSESEGHGQFLMSVNGPWEASSFSAKVDEKNVVGVRQVRQDIVVEAVQVIGRARDKNVQAKGRLSQECRDPFGNF